MEVVIYTSDTDGGVIEVKDKICSVLKPTNILFKSNHTFNESEESKQPYVLWSDKKWTKNQKY